MSRTKLAILISVMDSLAWAIYGYLVYSTFRDGGLANTLITALIGVALGVALVFKTVIIEDAMD